jgi:hypothetical protein
MAKADVAQAPYVYQPYPAQRYRCVGGVIEACVVSDAKGERALVGWFDSPKKATAAAVVDAVEADVPKTPKTPRVPKTPKTPKTPPEVSA